MLNLTSFALRNSRLVIIGVIGVIVIGLSTYMSYPRKEDPSVRVREGVITAYFPGMAPERIEDLITRPLEEKIREVPEVKDIRSDSKSGVSLLHIEIGDEYDDLQPIWQSLRNKMIDVRSQLPQGTIGPIVNDEVGLTAVATIALWSDGFSLREMRDAARDVRDSLYSLEGIKKIEIYGEQPERIYMEVSNAKLAEYGVSPVIIIDTLQKQNVILPGGTVSAAGVDVVIEPSGNFRSVRDIEDVVFAIPSTGQAARLGDLVKVTRGYRDPAIKPVYFNGKQAIVVSVSITDGTNSVEFGKRLTTRLREFVVDMPIGYVIEYATFQPDLVELAVSDAVSNVYQTLVIVLIVVMLFLGPRTGAIVGTIVPLSMLLALIIMRQLQIDLQRVSIAAMIIALGLLVDNGIVVAEDIRRRFDTGADRLAACAAAGRSLSVPLLTSSLTTIFAFLPMMLAVGSTGEYTRSLSQVIIIILLGSWFLAMTVTPPMSMWFMKNVKMDKDLPVKDPYDTRLYRSYLVGLKGILRHRGAFLGMIGLALIGAFYMFGKVPKAFFPDSDRNQFLVYIDLPAGTNSQETGKLVKALSTWLADKRVNPEITGNVGYVGDGGPRFYSSLSPPDPDGHLAFLVATTQTGDQVLGAIKRARAYISETFPQARGKVKTMWLGSSESGLIAVRISGPDADYLFEKARQLEAEVHRIPGALNVVNDWQNRTFKARIEIDQARARRAQVTSEEIANSLATFLSGSEITNFREGDTIIPIVLRGAEAERNDLSVLQSITVYSVSRDAHVLLSQIADIKADRQFSLIKRHNQKRTVTVKAKHEVLGASQFADLIAPAVEALDLKEGYEWAWGGELEESAEAQGRLFGNMPYCLLAIVLLLIWQFNSFRRPLVIILTIPLSFIGAIVGLFVMKATFGFMAILGFFSLAGIIINNGIVLIDRIDQERSDGHSVNEAVVHAAVARLRPIAMTTITTVLGLTPLILFGGPLWYGMANVIAYGLAVGTILTLGVVPVLYSLFFEEGRFLDKAMQRITGET